MRRILLFIALTAAMFAARGACAEEKRVALVIGNSAYKYVPALDNPRNDARLIAKTLADLGFTLVGGGPQIDLDRQSFETMVRSFGRQIPGAGVALFYYAGHGLQVQGTNWLVPVTANPTGVTDLDFEMVDADLVLKQMEAAGARLNLMILDACRNNPFSGRGLRDAGGGLAQMKAPEGTLISYATQPGNVARDGDDGDSPYSKALAHTMREPGMDIFQLFNTVGLDVKRATGGEQQPWVSNSPIDGAFSFAGPAQAQAKAPTTPQVAQPGFDPRQIEIALWESVKDSKDPADFQEYLKQYPQGSFAGLARNRLAGLKAPSAPATAQPQVAVLTPPATQPARPAPPPKPTPPAWLTQALADPQLQRRLEASAQTERRELGVPALNRLHDQPLHGATPNQIPGGQVVTTKDLLHLLQGDAGAPVMLLDVLGGTDMLPGAVGAVAASSPGSFLDPAQQQLEQFLAKSTGRNLDAVLVFYCAGMDCWMSYNAALRAVHLGYRKVRWYRGGLEAWKSIGLPTVAAARGLTQPVMPGSFGMAR